jgi:hypothetical protein
MKNIAAILAFLMIFTSLSCKKVGETEATQEYNIECGEMNVAILSTDKDKINQLLTAFLNSRAPKITSTDPYGYQGHYNTLVSQLSGCSLLSSTAGCYNCTTPSNSSIIYVKAQNSATSNKLTIQFALTAGKMYVQSITATP